MRSKVWGIAVHLKFLNTVLWKGQPNQVIRVGHASPYVCLATLTYLEVHNATALGGLADYLTSQLTGAEIATSYLVAEKSDFVRFNQAKVRQPGSVTQANLQVRLINGQKQTAVTLGLVGDLEQDKALIRTQLDSMRELLLHLPEDPHLLINTDVQSSEQVADNALMDTSDMVDDILTQSEGLDCVGILASGSNYRGFANSLGQRNWFANHNFGGTGLWCTLWTRP